ncbi:hypothetical protein Btru_030477 [Bulinus truncatus]|nr:hypothetical protein Btru_030477 [Bulinus truncatus]
MMPWENRAGHLELLTTDFHGRHLQQTFTTDIHNRCIHLMKTVLVWYLFYLLMSFKYKIVLSLCLVTSQQCRDRECSAQNSDRKGDNRSLRDQTVLKNLTTAYLETDKAISSLTRWVVEPNITYFQSADDYHGRIKDFRSLVLSSSVPNVTIPQVIKFYSDDNAVIVRWVGQFIQHSKSGDLWKTLVGYYMLILSKEQAGVERALGSTYYAKDYQLGRLSPWQTIPLADYQLGRLLTWQTVHLADYQLGRLFTWQTISLADCQLGRLSPWQTINLADCSLGRLSPWQTINLADCSLSRLSTWQTVHLADCPLGRLSAWQTVHLADYQLDRLSP